MPRAVVVGGSIAGLTTAFALARAGWDIDVIERDPLPDATNAEEAFAHHPRPAVPQAGHSHSLFGAAYATWRDRAPQVLDALHADGVGLLRVADRMPPALVGVASQPGDEDFVGLRTRRSTYEWSLRRIVASHPSVRLRVAAVQALVGEVGSVPLITGVRVGDSIVDADLVVDASGRRTSSDDWITSLGGRSAPFEAQECAATYYTRYFRMHDPSAQWPVLNRGIASGGQYQAHFGVCMPADHDAFSITLVVPPLAEPLRSLRYPDAFDAVARITPMVAPWMDFGTPISDVRIIAGFRNSIRRDVVTAPYAHNFIVIGDAFMHTDPTFARGISVATMTAFRLAEVVSDFSDPADRDAAWRSVLTECAVARYDDVFTRIGERNDLWKATWNGDVRQPAPIDGDLVWADVARAAAVDETVWRAVARYLQVLATYDEMITPALLDRVRLLRDAGDLPPVPAGPTPDELTAALEPTLART
jgi:2-polyprenyl-6-methoxyphenol hydroxylase-like FAD-dependent oxidoreductase